MSSSGMRIRGRSMRDNINRLSIRNSTPALNILVIVAFVVHALYITERLWNYHVSQILTTSFSHNLRFPSSHAIYDESPLSRDNDSGVGNDDEVGSVRGARRLIEDVQVVPRLFIFRRTKKTGSSAMLAELLSQLVPLGYTPLYFQRGEMEIVVRNEYVRRKPRLLLIAEHNRITRRFHPRRLAVIADTIRDGYEQMTSFCRYVRKVPSCDPKLIIACLQSKEALSQLNYRWANKIAEDDDTYIDLPLSSAHPALSTTIMRTVYPNVTLDVSAYNVKHSACADLDDVRAVYNQLYVELERQVLELKQRMLLIAGYPIMDGSGVIGGSEMGIPIDDMLDAAEELERKKYVLSERTIPSTGAQQEKVKRKIGYSEQHLQLRASVLRWTNGSDGKLSLKSRRG